MAILPVAMDRDEALSLLGVDAGADPRTVKRAYLRRLKKTKPERDPEGFKRLREAYELLEQEQDHQEEDHEHEPQPEFAPSSANVVEVPQPPSSEPRASFADCVHDIHMALEDGDLDRACEQAAAAIARSESMEAPALPAALMVDLTLSALSSASDPAPARYAFRSWSAHSNVFDATRGELENDELAKLALVAELVELPPDFPRPVAQLIATALFSGDPDSERDRLCDLTDERPAMAIHAQETLMRHAPGLAAIYSASLDTGTPDTRRDAGDHPLVKLLFFVFAFGLAAFLNASHCGCQSP
ncbi:MAG: J domain-containing protein [Myxococcales bacterium]|nr:J domain-containing protein [Myxococcales bacterium]